MFYTFKTGPEMMAHQVNTKIEYGDYEISIAMDDSCGAMKNLSRTSISIFRKSTGENVTEELFGRVRLTDGYLDAKPATEIYNPSSVTLLQVMNQVHQRARREAGY